MAMIARHRTFLKFMHITLLAVGLLFWSAASLAAGAWESPAAASAPSLAPLADTIRGRLPGLASSRQAPMAQALDSLYRPGGYAPVWLDAAGRPTPWAAQALAVLAEASADGLDPGDYGSAALALQASALRAPASPTAADALDFELRLSMAFLGYLREVHLGRLDPHALGYHVSARASEPDVGAALRAALGHGTGLRELASGMAPRYGQYRQLREALARYRALASGPAWPALPPLERALRPGDSHPALVALQQRLVALGDMPPTALPAAPAVGLDPALAEAVKRFQRRHGLAADGVVGRATVAALEVPLAHRVRQIEFAMERLRWLPPLQGRPVVAINIPMYRLWAYTPRDHSPRDMAVIVGQALRTRTPVLMHDMRQVIFRPYWNVPRSILRNEILPRLRRDPGYLQRNDMEIVRGAGDDAARMAPTPANLELLAQGALRLRQRPGPRNSLGLVKFVLPNDENIYLHDTPATELFQRARRDFSHGCVRVEDPVALAQWVLADQPAWTRERIVETMQGTITIAVNLQTPVQVVIYYVTAMVLPGDAGLAFAEDIYGHDAALEAALRTRRPAP
jgi:L,D-transpeptidase YcbB